MNSKSNIRRINDYNWMPVYRSFKKLNVSFWNSAKCVAWSFEDFEWRKIVLK